MLSTQSCSRAVPPLLPLDSSLHPRPTCGFSVSMAMEHRNCCGPGAFSGCFPAGLPYPHSKSDRRFPTDHVWRFMEESMGCVHEKSLWQHLTRRFWAVPPNPGGWNSCEEKGKKGIQAVFQCSSCRARMIPLPRTTRELENPEVPYTGSQGGQGGRRLQSWNIIWEGI